MSSFNFTRQILAFVGIWAILIYIFITKLNTTGAKDSEEITKLNQALAHLDRTRSLDNELKQLLDEYANDINNGDTKLELLKRINSKFQESAVDNSAIRSGPVGVPSLEYELQRRRLGTNILELWNYINAEAKKIEKTIKNERDSPQTLKQLEGFVHMAREQKR